MSQSQNVSAALFTSAEVESLRAELREVLASCGVRLALCVPFTLVTTYERMSGGYLSDDERISYGPSRETVRVETPMMFPLDGSEPFERSGDGSESFEGSREVVSKDLLLSWEGVVEGIALLAQKGIRTACLRGESGHEIFGTGSGWSARYPEGNWWNFPPQWDADRDGNAVRMFIRLLRAKAWEKEAIAWLEANPVPKMTEFGLRGKVPSWLREEKSKRRCPQMRWCFDHQAKHRAVGWFPNSGPGVWVWAITSEGEDHLVRHEEEEDSATFFQFWGLDQRSLVVAWEVREVMVDGHRTAERFGEEEPNEGSLKHRYKVLQAPQGGLSAAQREWAEKLRERCDLFYVPEVLRRLTS